MSFFNERSRHEGEILLTQKKNLGAGLAKGLVNMPDLLAVQSVKPKD